MEHFIKELEIGEIHQRDRWQFELKTEYFPLNGKRRNQYTQEFYFFIPNALQVNEETYSKENFYRDLTNFIRYKTPQFELEQLSDEKEERSPLNHLKQFLHLERSAKVDSAVTDELKLLGNVLRSSLRERVRRLIEIADNDKNPSQESERLCQELRKFREMHLSLQSAYLKTWTSLSDKAHFLYIDEFISNSINYYLTGLLQYIRRSGIAACSDADKEICLLLAAEKAHREQILKEPKIQEADAEGNEYVLYRSGILNKYVLDALLLDTRRASVGKRFRNLIGSIAAGIAMFFFFYLFVKQGSVFLINSTPFILITVILYILKDRLKEGLKTASYQQFAKWFSDYKTDIFSPTSQDLVGKMREYASFVGENKVSPEIIGIRNREFHEVLETFKRPEKILYYKKEISLFKLNGQKDPRREALNIIFRFNISGFLLKADNPTHPYVTVDTETKDLKKVHLPKVYHMNVILKNTFFEEGAKKMVELKKFRLILDKNGIKRVEHLS